MTRVCHLCVEQQRSGDALLDKVGGGKPWVPSRPPPEPAHGNTADNPNSLIVGSRGRNLCADSFSGGGAKAGAASDRVDGDLSLRLQGREDDALPQRHDAPGGPRRRGTAPDGRRGLLAFSVSRHSFLARLARFAPSGDEPALVVTSAVLVASDATDDPAADQTPLRPRPVRGGRGGAQRRGAGAAGVPEEQAGLGPAERHPERV